MNGLPEHTSAAQLSLYANCPRKYRLRYIEREPPEYRSVSLALGSTVHSAIGWWVERRKAGQRPSSAELAAIVRADLTAATDASTRYGKWTHPDLERHAQRLVECFVGEHGDLPVNDIEARFDLELVDPETGEVMPRKLLGYFDFVLADRTVVELKTARSDYSDVAIAGSLQFGGYRLALDHFGLGQMRVLAIIKNVTPRLQEVRLAPDAKAARFFLEAACSIETAILAGHFPPAPGFGCGMCEYQHRCLGVGEAQRGQAA